jgi:hypothetical protein
MFRLTSKVKIAAGIAAGALTLGAAGAYAAANANSTITVQSPTAIPLPSGPTLISVNGKTLTLPTTFANHGACISFFAKNRDFALAPQTLGATVTVSKNYHGKLVSGLQSWCDSQVKATSTTTSATTTDATESTTDSTDSTNSQAGALHGHGHANGRGNHANPTD